MNHLTDAENKREELVQKWAKFFDTAKVPYQFRAITFQLGEGETFTPDFYVGKTYGRVERKPCFFHVGSGADLLEKFNISTILLDEIPETRKISKNEDARTVADEILCRHYCDIAYSSCYYNFLTFDGDDFPCHIMVNQQGQLFLIGDDNSYFGVGEDVLYTYQVFQKINETRKSAKKEKE